MFEVCKIMLIRERVNSNKFFLPSHLNRIISVVDVDVGEILKQYFLLLFSGKCS